MRRAPRTAAASFAAGACLVAAASLLAPNTRRGSNPTADRPAGLVDTPRVVPRGRDDTTTVVAVGSPFDGVEVAVVGHQSRWRVGYRVPGGGTARPAADEDGPGGTSVARVPADSDVRLILTSRDFVYMLSVPRLHQSEVAVPGREFRLEFRTQGPGVLALAGGHLCGPPTPALDLTVFVEPRPAFDARLAQIRGADR